ncbi:ferritin heavy chain B-like [Heptranchias perlo]|uniref:ferritin heavy chain B-like n=1 Tax=Heptranchias perlo TaxID=212740 RepID=UPI00355A13C5
MGLALGLSKVVIYRSRLDPAHGDGRSDRLPLFRSILRTAMALEREHAVSAGTFEAFRDGWLEWIPRCVRTITRSEDGVNKQINMELYSSYVYLSISYYFDRDDVALHHFVKFFKEQSQEKHEDAEKLLKFQNHLGGYPVNWLRLPFQKPEQDEWSNGLEAMQRALQMEKDVNQSLLDLHKLSTEDRPSCKFLMLLMWAFG